VGNQRGREELFSMEWRKDVTRDGLLSLGVGYCRLSILLILFFLSFIKV
jgi:hypothetical protein